MLNGFIPVAGNIYERRQRDGIPTSDFQFYCSIIPMANHRTYSIHLCFTDIADLLGASRQMVSKHIKRLDEKEWLTYYPNHPACPGGLITLHVGLWDKVKGKVTQALQKGNGDVTINNIGVTSALPERGQEIVETQAPLDVERLTSVNQLNTETKNMEHVAAESHSFLRSTEGKEGNDREGDEADMIDMGNEWRRKYASMQGDNKLLSLDERAELCMDKATLIGVDWDNANDKGKLELLELFETE